MGIKYTCSVMKQGLTMSENSCTSTTLGKSALCVPMHVRLVQLGAGAGPRCLCDSRGGTGGAVFPSGTPRKLHTQSNDYWTL